MDPKERAKKLPKPMLLLMDRQLKLMAKQRSLFTASGKSCGKTKLKLKRKIPFQRKMLHKC